MLNKGCFKRQYENYEKQFYLIFRDFTKHGKMKEFFQNNYVNIEIWNSFSKITF